MPHSGAFPRVADAAGRFSLADGHAYEAVGLRDTGEIFAVEILGRQTEAVALHTAQKLADLWQVGVKLYLVPFVTFGPAPWRDDQMELVRQLVPTRMVEG